MNPYPGEIWLTDLGLAAKTRLVLIVFHYDPDPPRAMITYVSLTTQYGESFYEVVLPKLNFLNQDSYANVLGIGSIEKVRLQRRLGKLPEFALCVLPAVLLF